MDALRDCSETTLIAFAQQGRREAMGELARRHMKQVHGLARQLSGNHEDADAITQETFMRAFQGLGRFRQDAQFSTWLMRIAINLSRSYFRKSSTAAVYSLEEVTGDSEIETDGRDGATQSDPLEIAHSREVRGMVRQAVDQLPENERLAIILTHIQGLPYSQASRLLGCSIGSLAWRIHHAKEHLRKRLRSLLTQ
ncbi:MAG: sigma-70 family RNA polymerase sigma factor [Planctomycetia bacterium]|nr:sigma-70 family RNA polymerase sigma factor [Planctomycetia bacterium]